MSFLTSTKYYTEDELTKFSKALVNRDMSILTTEVQNRFAIFSRQMYIFAAWKRIKSQ